MRKTKLLKSILFAAAVALSASTLTSCDGLYLGFGGNVGMPFPGGSVNLNLGTTIPLSPPIDPGLPGYRPGWGGGFHPGPMRPGSGPMRPAPGYPGF